jgi:hypothetical protein
LDLRQICIRKGGEEVLTGGRRFGEEVRGSGSKEVDGMDPEARVLGSALLPAFYAMGIAAAG